MKNKVIRKVFFPLILAKDQKNCDGFGEIKNVTKYEEIISKEKMVRPAGLEPVTPTMSRWCSNQLSYSRVKDVADDKQF